MSLAGLLLLLSCGPAPELDDAALLRRASLDLRGVLPSEAELAELEDDPQALDALLDGLLLDPRFPQRAADLMVTPWRTRTAMWTLDLSALSDEVDPERLPLSLGEEIAQVLAEMAAEDLPYTTLLTADWTMSDEVLAAIWPLEREPGEGWQRARYTDGRPAAGVLSSNSLWWRYTSSSSNANRARANALHRVLLCHDFAARPVEATLNTSLQDDDAIETAVRSDPGCVSCHASLDPIASGLYGFFHVRDDVGDALRYHPERELRWAEVTGAAPAFNGAPVRTIAELGRAIAADERFARCAVETAFEAMVQREASADDIDELTAIREVFLSEGLTLRALMRGVLRSPSYRSAERAAMLTPEQLAAVIEDQTGFYWEGLLEQPLMRTDVDGLLSIAGGSDGASSPHQARSPTAGMMLTHRRLAQSAAAHMLRQGPGQGQGLTVGADASDDEAVEAQLVALVTRLHGAPPEREELDSLMTLYKSVAANDAYHAWVAVLTALLLSPKLLLY